MKRERNRGQVDYYSFDTADTKCTIIRSVLVQPRRHHSTFQQATDLFISRCQLCKIRIHPLSHLPSKFMTHYLFIFSASSEFVASEQDEFSEYSVRHSGGELLTQICKGGKERSFRYIFHPSILEDLSCFSTFNTAQSINSKALDASTILRMESVMWCVGCLGVAYTRHCRLEERYRRRAGRDIDDSFEVNLLQFA